MLDMTSEEGFGLATAKRLLEASEHEWPTIVDKLRRTGKLSLAVRQINTLLYHPEHQGLARSALRRIGLESAG